MVDKRWYLALDGQMDGPYTQGEVTAKIRAGEADERFFVFAQGEKQWHPLAASATFADAFADDPAPLPDVPPPPPPGRPILRVKPKAPRRRRRWLRGLMFALLLGAAGFYGGALLTGGGLGPATGALIGAILGFLLAGRKPADPRQPGSNSGADGAEGGKGAILAWLGLFLGLGGIGVSYLLYQPDVWCLYEDTTGSGWAILNPQLCATDMSLCATNSALHVQIQKKYRQTYMHRCEKMCEGGLLQKWQCLVNPTTQLHFNWSR